MTTKAGDRIVMGKTFVEKILNHAAGSDHAISGDIVHARVSHLMTNDAVGEMTVQAFNTLGIPPWDPARIKIVLDHYTPATTEDAARVHQILREFARMHDIDLFDHRGICHQIMLENFVLPGEVVIGTDSHTCTYGGLGVFATGVGASDGAAVMATGKIWLKIPATIRIDLLGRLPRHVHPKDLILKVIGQLGADGATYKALQFSGAGSETLSIEGRLTICNMAVEAGAKTAIFEPDAVTRAFLINPAGAPLFFHSDPDATYCDIIAVKLDHLVPQIACPYSVDQVVPVDRVEGIAINQAFIGSCTNGRLEDLRVAAKVLAGKRISSHVRLLVAPASNQIYQQAIAEGLVEIFLQAGATICNSGCSACFGGQGMLAENEVCIGTHNRNFRGRMGHYDAQVFLASPETVARSAIAGCITDPRK